MSSTKGKRVTASEDGVKGVDEPMAEVGGKRKSSRLERPRRKRNRTDKKPPASLYVGYVEDGETVEMIMKKFQKLEEIKQRKEKEKQTEEGKNEGAEGKAGESGQKGEMTEKELEEVFNETANFNLDKVRTDGLHSYNYDEIEDVDDEGWDLSGVQLHESEEGEVTYFFGDGTDDDLWDELFGTKKKRKPASKRGVVRGEKSVTKIAFVSDMHGRYVTGLRKIRKVDPNAIVYQKVPKVLPLSWAKIIKPYAPPEAVHTQTNWRPGKIICLETQQSYTKEMPQESDMQAFAKVEDVDLVSLAATKDQGFQGIVLSPPWKERFPTASGEPYNTEGIVPKDLLKLKLGNTKVIEAGFVYIWSPKHLLHEILKVMERMNFFYVENAINVRQAVSNDIQGLESQYFKSSKETLLILRRGKRNPKNQKVEWSRVEIRHQRTSDVNFTFYANNSTGKERYAHSYIHNMAETMLPHGRYNPLPPENEKGAEANAKGSPQAEAAWLSKEKQRKQQGRLLHLWAPQDVRRTGWTSVAIGS